MPVAFGGLSMSLTEETRNVVRCHYGQAIGQPVETVTTPALLLDLPAARRNIQRMADQMASLPATLRPHVKTHKSPDLALLQARAGARGFSTATVWEAVILAEAGIDDLFVVNTVVGLAKIRCLVNLARTRRVLVAVDNLANASELSREAAKSDVTLGVLIEIDTGMRRCGLSEPAMASELAQRLVELTSGDGSSCSVRRWRSCSPRSPRSRRLESHAQSSPPAEPRRGG
jgi:D-serine deaminase-like pyridoxal phosphate-dependent protein